MQDEDGMFCGAITELKSCHARANTREELKGRLRDAIRIFAEDAVDIELNYFDAGWV